jgi:predicted glutamine amidotransferase
MSLAFAVFTSDPNLLQCELLRLEDEVSTSESVGSNAVGLGSYAQDEVLFQRFRSPVEMKSMARRWAGRESDALLYHACELPPSMSPEENTQPFRYRRWMFCHTGPSTDLARLKGRLLPLIPDFLQRQIRGATGGELLFALFLKLLRDAGRIDDPSIDPALTGQLLGRAVRLVEEMSGEAGTPRMAALNCIATNGSLLVATRHGGEPLFYALLEGSAHCERCGIDSSTLETLPVVRAHRRRRTIALASHPTRSSKWIEIPDGATIAIGRDLSLQQLPV